MNVKLNARQKKWEGIESSAKHKREGSHPDWAHSGPSDLGAPPNLYYN